MSCQPMRKLITFVCMIAIVSHFNLSICSSQTDLVEFAEKENAPEVNGGKEKSQRVSAEDETDNFGRPKLIPRSPSLPFSKTDCSEQSQRSSLFTDSAVELEVEFYKTLASSPKDLRKVWEFGQASVLERPFDVEEGYQADFQAYAGLEGYVVQGKMSGSPVEADHHLSAWQAMKPSVQCKSNFMTLTVTGRGYINLLVDRVDALPISVLQLPPHCGYLVKTTCEGLQLLAPYKSCYITKQSGRYVLPLLWWGSPVQFSCPVQPSPAQSAFPRIPLTVRCSAFGMTMHIPGGKNAESTPGVIVNGVWAPLVSDKCALHIDFQPEDLFLYCPFTAPCITHQNKAHLHLLIAGLEYLLSCPPHLSVPPLLPYPPFPQPLSADPVAPEPLPIPPPSSASAPGRLFAQHVQLLPFHHPDMGTLSPFNLNVPILDPPPTPPPDTQSALPATQFTKPPPTLSVEPDSSPVSCPPNCKYPYHLPVYDPFFQSQDPDKPRPDLPTVPTPLPRDAFAYASPVTQRHRPQTFPPYHEPSPVTQRQRPQTVPPYHVPIPVTQRHRPQTVPPYHEPSPVTQRHRPQTVPPYHEPSPVTQRHRPQTFPPYHEPSPVTQRHRPQTFPPYHEPSPVTQRHRPQTFPPYHEPSPVTQRHRPKTFPPYHEPSPVTQTQGPQTFPPYHEPSPVTQRHGRQTFPPYHEPSPVTQRQRPQTVPPYHVPIPVTQRHRPQTVPPYHEPSPVTQTQGPQTFPPYHEPSPVTQRHRPQTFPPYHEPSPVTQRHRPQTFPPYHEPSPVTQRHRPQTFLPYHEPSPVTQRHGRQTFPPYHEPSPVTQRQRPQTVPPYHVPIPVTQRHRPQTVPPYHEPSPVTQRHGRQTFPPYHVPIPVTQRHRPQTVPPYHEPSPVTQRHGRQTFPPYHEPSPVTQRQRPQTVPPYHEPSPVTQTQGPQTFPPYHEPSPVTQRHGPQTSPPLPAKPRLTVSLQCLGGRVIAKLPYAQLDSLQVKDRRKEWTPISSVPVDCGYVVKRVAGFGVTLVSPLPACHSYALSPMTLTLSLRYLELKLNKYRILELQCPSPSASDSRSLPMPATSSSTVPPRPSRLSPPKFRLFCSDHHMRVELPPGPISGIVVKDVKDNEMSLTDAPKHCGYSASQLDDGRINLSLPFNPCHMTVQVDKHRIHVVYITRKGKKRGARLSCPVSGTVPSQECQVPSERRLPCGSGALSEGECLSLGCCSSPLRPSCYYSTDQCTADGHFVFSVPASLADPPLSTALLVAAGDDSCTPQRVSRDHAVFKIPLEGCGTHRYEMGNTVIYLLEVLYKAELNHGSQTRDSAIRLTVECRYTPGSGSVGYFHKSPTLGPSIQTQGVFGVQLRIATDAQYINYYPQYHRPLQTLVGNPVYLEVRLLNPPDPSVLLLVHYCVAYERSGRSTWVLLYNGCLVSQRPVPRDHTRRFTIDTFQFLSKSKGSDTGEEIYFMCSTQVCSPADDPCVEGCFSH